MNVTSSAIECQITDSIAVVRFNQPHQRNPLSRSTLEALHRTTSSLFSRQDITALIFTGSDTVFASGADIRELVQLDTSAALEFSKMGQGIFQRIAEAKQITVAAINGYCMGGALDLALACDLRVASKSAVFAHPGAARGIITGWGGTQRLPRVVGRSRAMELFATARNIDSAEALRIGLISAVQDPVLDYCLKLVRRRG